MDVIKEKKNNVSNIERGCCFGHYSEIAPECNNCFIALRCKIKTEKIKQAMKRKNSKAICVSPNDMLLAKLKEHYSIKKHEAEKSFRYTFMLEGKEVFYILVSKLTGNLKVKINDDVFFVDCLKNEDEMESTYKEIMGLL